MIRVLHYVGNMNRGGMETFIMNLYREIDRNKVQFDFAIHGSVVGDYESEIVSYGGKAYYFPHMRKNPLKYRKTWREFWKQNGKEYTVFHMHTNSLANIIALEEATKANIPIRIVHSHSSMANKGQLQWLNDFLHKRNQKRLGKLATDLFACSDKAAKWLFGEQKTSGLSVRQINNGIDTAKFRFNPEIRRQIRGNMGLEHHKVIGHIGAFIPVKNHKFLVDVVEQMYKKDSSIRCILIGTGDLCDEIKRIVRQRGLEHVILFLGVCANVNELLSAMDLFLMPSFYEGLPVSLVEVQTNGVPALVSDSITKDVKMKNNLHYISLSESSEDWADEALRLLSEGNREINIDVIIENGFDIKSTVSVYEEIIMKGRARYAADETKRARIN